MRFLVRPAEARRPSRLLPDVAVIVRVPTLDRLALLVRGDIQHTGRSRRRQVGSGGPVVGVRDDREAMGPLEVLRHGLRRWVVSRGPQRGAGRATAIGLTARAWARFCSGVASGSKEKAVTPAFLASSTMSFWTSSAAAALLAAVCSWSCCSCSFWAWTGSCCSLAMALAWPTHRGSWFDCRRGCSGFGVEVVTVLIPYRDNACSAKSSW